MSFQALYSTAIDLQPRDKAALAYGLLSTLDTEADEDTSALWLEESARRFAEYQERRQSISARDCIARIALEANT